MNTACHTYIHPTLPDLLRKKKKYVVKYADHGPCAVKSPSQLGESRQGVRQRRLWAHKIPRGRQELTSREVVP